jgi:hypothetical protein
MPSTTGYSSFRTWLEIYHHSEIRADGCRAGHRQFILVDGLIPAGQIWHYEGFFPLSRWTLKPVGAGLGMAGTMCAVDLLP